MRKILLLGTILFVQCFVSSVNAQEVKVKTEEIRYSLCRAVSLYVSEELKENVVYSGKINRVVTQYIESADEVVLYIYTDKGHFEIKPCKIDGGDEKRDDLFYALTVADVNDVIFWIYDGWNIILKPLKLADNKKK